MDPITYLEILVLSVAITLVVSFVGTIAYLCAYYEISPIHLFRNLQNEKENQEEKEKIELEKLLNSSIFFFIYYSTL